VGNRRVPTVEKGGPRDDPFYICICIVSFAEIVSEFHAKQSLGLRHCDRFMLGNFAFQLIICLLAQ
jgi:hypothetical protein